MLTSLVKFRVVVVVFFLNMSTIHCSEVQPCWRCNNPSTTGSFGRLMELGNLVDQSEEAPPEY